MDFFTEGLDEAQRLILRGDPLVIGATVRTLWISLTAVTLATLLGLPIGTWLARRTFRGHRLVLTGVRAGMAVPTVFLGIVCYGLFSRRGPLGPLDLLYSPLAIIAGETLLALPIVIALFHGALSSLDPRVGETARTLGAGRLRRWATYLWEARTGVVLALLTAFARCSTELGIAMMVGGNFRNRTQTLATATAGEARKGEFATALAMGSILLLLAIGVTIVVVAVSGEGKKSA